MGKRTGFQAMAWMGIASCLVTLGGERVVASPIDGVTLPFYGWTCHSQVEELPIYVDVMLNRVDGHYGMRVTSAGLTPEAPEQVIAAFRRVQFDMNERTIRFLGSNRRISADLTIDRGDGIMRDLDSNLVVTHTLVTTRERIPPEATFKLTCSPTR